MWKETTYLTECKKYWFFFLAALRLNALLLVRCPFIGDFASSGTLVASDQGAGKQLCRESFQNRLFSLILITREKIIKASCLNRRILQFRRRSTMCDWIRSQNIRVNVSGYFFRVEYGALFLDTNFKTLVEVLRKEKKNEKCTLSRQSSSRFNANYKVQICGRDLYSSAVSVGGCCRIFATKWFLIATSLMIHTRSSWSITRVTWLTVVFQLVFIVAVISWRTNTRRSLTRPAKHHERVKTLWDFGRQRRGKKIFRANFPLPSAKGSNQHSFLYCRCEGIENLPSLAYLLKKKELKQLIQSWIMAFNRILVA